MPFNDRADDPRLARRRAEDLEERFGRLRRDGSSGADFATGRTVNPASGPYPTASGVFFTVSMTAVGGPEHEGSAVTVSVTGPVVPALALGSGVPPLGTDVVMFRQDGRWAFIYYG